MHIFSNCLVIVVVCRFYWCEANFNDGYGELVVRVLGGPSVVQLLAKETGHFYKGPVIGFDDTYILLPFNNETYLGGRKRDGFYKTKRIVEDHRVVWAEKQLPRSRQKRDLIDPADVPISRVKRLEDGRSVYKRPLSRKFDKTFNDELWPQQWYLRDTRAISDLPKLDLNVLPLYKAGVTGKGIRISILDDGIEYTHQDLHRNYDPEISYDCNENDNDPLPRYDSKKTNSHGTRCAGEVAMAANNKKCGVGIAFNAKIGGVKLLDGIVTDRIEGTALSYAQDLVDIYSASWGPNDDGKTVDGPGRMAQEAIEKGIRNGRNGKGSIFVWASGNGGSKGDNCNCDGYLASPYTVSIGSASQKGAFPWYGEACASTLAVTYSSGAYKDQMIATTDLNDECTIKHTGTSASAPLAAGIIALALEVNPQLTWRDIQHLIVWTSELAPLSHNPGWIQNAAGLWFNTRFGFGLMNAYGLVKLASNWTQVAPKSICTVKASPRYLNATFSYGNPLELVIYTTGCKGTDQEVRYLEHVETLVNIDYTLRGVLEIYMISPSGTQIQLLQPRKLDNSDLGFKNWKFMSVMNWGEKAKGVWKLLIVDNKGPEGNFGKIGEIKLFLHGTKTLPHHMRDGRRNYNENYNTVHASKADMYYDGPDMINELLYEYY